MGFDVITYAASKKNVSGNPEVEKQIKKLELKLEQKADANEVNSELSNKVDKVDGKQLSTNDFTNEYKAKVDSAAQQATTYTKTEVNATLDGKVDKVAGKGLSTNDFTNADKSKLGGLKNYDDTDVKADIIEAANQAAINKRTLGCQVKNVLLNNCKAKTLYGVTSTVNENGSITLTGSNTNSSAFILYWNMQTGTAATTLAGQYVGNKKWIPNGKYILSGSKSGANIQVRLAEEENSEGTSVTSSNSNETTFTVTDTHKYVWARLLIEAGADFSTPVTVYPMIRPAEITDDTYEPYKPSVEERIAALEAAVMEGGVT